WRWSRLNPKRGPRDDLDRPVPGADLPGPDPARVPPHRRGGTAGLRSECPSRGGSGTGPIHRPGAIHSPGLALGRAEPPRPLRSQAPCADRVPRTVRDYPTRTPGLRFTELVPQLASRSDRFALVRSNVNFNPNHREAGSIALTGAAEAAPSK